MHMVLSGSDMTDHIDLIPQFPGGGTGLITTMLPMATHDEERDLRAQTMIHRLIPEPYSGQDRVQIVHSFRPSG